MLVDGHALILGKTMNFIAYLPGNAEDFGNAVNGQPRRFQLPSRFSHRHPELGSGSIPPD
jgi:hypothetical protein